MCTMRAMRILKAVKKLCGEVCFNRQLILQLAHQDYKNKYIGSFLGFTWTVIQPLVMIVILWIVFGMGFKVQEVNGVPFVAWLTVAMIAWNFFSETLMAATNVFNEYSYLVKKVNFKFVMLPFVKILSGLVTHLIFLAILVVILDFSNVGITIYWFQFLYYLLAMVVFLLGLSWITSSLQVFVKDVSQIVSIVVQFGFWLTPIFWDISLLPEKYHFWIRLNPMFYLVEGYRKSFIYGQPFWNDYRLGIYYWIIALVVLVGGFVLFKRLKPHFADVL